MKFCVMKFPGLGGDGSPPGIAGAPNAMKRFEVRSEPVPIAAPAAVVWGVLTDPENYGAWNPFTPEARTDFRIGSPAHLRVRMGPATFPMIQTVCTFEEPRRIAWRKTFGARWLLANLREQRLEPAGDGGCTYRNTETLTGLLAPAVFLLFGGYMRRGFNAAGAGLKRYAEAKVANAQAGAIAG